MSKMAARTDTAAPCFPVWCFVFVFLYSFLCLFVSLYLLIKFQISLYENTMTIKAFLFYSISHFFLLFLRPFPSRCICSLTFPTPVLSHELFLSFLFRILSFLSHPDHHVCVATHTPSPRTHTPSPLTHLWERQTPIVWSNASLLSTVLLPG